MALRAVSEKLLIMFQFLHNAPLTAGTGSALFLLSFSLCLVAPVHALWDLNHAEDPANPVDSKKSRVDALLVDLNPNPNSFYMV